MTEKIEGREFETLGLVKGSCIQTKNLGKDISQTFKNLVGEDASEEDAFKILSENKYFSERYKNV